MSISLSKNQLLALKYDFIFEYLATFADFKKLASGLDFSLLKEDVG